LEKHGVAPQMREDVGLNYGSYTSDVDGNFYEIWLQDADAVTSEMELVRDYDLAGAAAWKIGFESSPQIWEIIRDHLQ
jgi:spore germination protein YaaH